MKIILLIFILFLLSGCISKRGVSLQYYNDCKEYYDLQGFYHKDCNDENMVTYKEIKSVVEPKKKTTHKTNVW